MSLVSTNTHHSNKVQKYRDIFKYSGYIKLCQHKSTHATDCLKKEATIKKSLLRCEPQKFILDV